MLIANAKTMKIANQFHNIWIGSKSRTEGSHLPDFHPPAPSALLSRGRTGRARDPTSHFPLSHTCLLIFGTCWGTGFTCASGCWTAPILSALRWRTVDGRSLYGMHPLLPMVSFALCIVLSPGPGTSFGCEEKQETWAWQRFESSSSQSAS